MPAPKAMALAHAMVSKFIAVVYAPKPKNADVANDK
jgi:hypothetical protein